MILIGDVREKLKELPDKSVHCCVTSPPYFGLRDTVLRHGMVETQNAITKANRWLRKPTSIATVALATMSRMQQPESSIKTSAASVVRNALIHRSGWKKHQNNSLRTWSKYSVKYGVCCVTMGHSGSTSATVIQVQAKVQQVISAQLTMNDG